MMRKVTSNYPMSWTEITCNDWYEDESHIFLCQSNKNAICEIVKESGRVNVLGHYGSNGLAGESLSLSVERCGNYIVFSPCNADEIAVIKLPEKTLEFISFDMPTRCRQYIKDGKSKFYRMLMFDNKVFFFGLTIPTIMILDLETFDISFFDDWADELLAKVVNNDGTAIFFTDGIIRDGFDIYVPMGCAKEILKINLKRLEWEYINIPMIETGILGLGAYGEKFVISEMLNTYGRILVWDRKSKSVECINSPHKCDYYRPLIVDEQMYLLSNPTSKGMIYRYDFEEKQWEDISDKVFKNEEKIISYSYGNGIISFFTSGQNALWRYDIEKQQYSYVRYTLDAEPYNDFLAKTWMDWCITHVRENEGKLINEGSYGIKLYDYLYAITNKE